MSLSPLNNTRRVLRHLLFFFVLAGLAHQGAYSQTSTEFWFAPPEITQGHGGTGAIFVRLAAGAAGATVTIEMPANPGALNSGSPITVVLGANQSQTVTLTAFINDLETRPANTVLNTGLHISATEDITAIYEAGPGNNPDIWALKGANGLGTEFYTPMQNLWPNGNYSPTPYTSFDIVATEDNTTILIYPTSDLDGGQNAYESFTITLNQGETYSASVTDINNPENNPSGSIIVSDKPIAVSIKDDSISPPSQGCRDLVGDQIVPVDIVGNEYIVNKGGLNAGSREWAYVVATENNTQISVDGVFVNTLFNAETYPIEITNPLTYITGDKNFYLIHVSGFGCESGMAQLPPLNCAGSEQVSFVRSTNESFFINLLISAGSEDAFVVNGDAGIIDPTDFAVVPGTDGEWVGAQIQFNTTQIPVGVANLITNTEEVFSMGLINGGASSGCRFGYFSEFSSAIITDAGPDLTVCANQETILVGSVSGGATQGEWSTNGTGSFSPDATTFGATYEPSLADLSAGQVTLTLTSVGNCFPVEDEIEITYTPAPIVDAGLNIVACGNNTTVTLDGFVDIATGGLWSGGDGTFDPGTGTLDAEYTPSAQEIVDGSVELTLTSTGNGNCLEEFDTVEITFGPSPTADAGVDQSVCANNVQVVLSGAVTVSGGGAWSGGGGAYSPSDQALGATYTPSAVEILNGSLTLTLTTTNNGGCAQVTDQMTITITDAPNVDAGSDANVCSNNANITLNGSVVGATGGTWSGGNGTYSTDENDLAAVYTPSLAELLGGSVTLTLISTGNGNCLPETDQVTYTFTDPPAVNAGTDGFVCENNAVISLNGSLLGANFGLWSGGAGTFTPNTTTLTATYTPTAAEITSGSITLSLTSLDNGNCNPESDDVIFTFTPSPTADAGPDQSVCENNVDINLSGIVTIAGAGIWSGGIGSFSPNNTTLNAVYTPTTSEISSGSITLTLTTTDNGNCSLVSDNVTINFTDDPTANAGANQVLCANNSEISLGGSVTIATGGTWSGGLGTFTPNANTLNATYDPTQAEINSGSLTLTLTTTGGGNCIEVSDEIDFTFTPAPTAEAGVAISVCSNNAQISLNGSLTVASGGTWSGGAGTFIPDANTLNALYNPTAAEIAAGSLVLTLTTTGNGNCVPEDDFVNISFTPAPTSNAGSDQTVCANDTEVNLSGSISLASGAIWSGGSGIFLPNNTSLGASYTPSAAEITAGSATLTLTTTGNGNCNAESDQMVIDITPAPVVDAGVGIELCSNNPEFTLGGSVTVVTGATWSGGNGTFVPDANDLNATYTPSQGEINAGTLTLTLTSTGNGNCVAVSDVVTYTFGPSPTSDAGVDILACANNAIVQLDGAVTIATGGAWSGGAGNFSPSANALDASYAPTLAEIAAGSLTLTLTTTDNGDCLPVTDEVEITFTPAPTANAGTDQTVCANAAEVTLSGSISIASGGTWSGGNGSFDNSSFLGAIYTPTALEIAAGTVTLTLTTTGNGDCNAVTDQMIITITPAPVVDAGVGLELCSNNPEISLSGSVTIATGGTWSGGSGTFTPNANDLNATYAPSQSEINAGTLTLTLTSTGNGNCAAVADNITYTFGPSPTADAGADIVLCSNNADVQLAGAVTIATDGTWSGGAGTFSPNANTLTAEYTPTALEIAAGTITLTLTTTGNGDCLAVTDEVEITFTPSPTANASVDQTVCANAVDVTLNGTVTIASGGTWSGGLGSFSPDANTLGATYTPTATEIAAGTVTLTLTTTGNGDCIAVTDQMVITITPDPTVDAGVGIELCSNNPEITLNGSVTIASGGTWSGGSGTFTPNANDLNATYAPSQSEINAGTLTLTLTSTGNGNCVAVTDDVTYTFGPSPTSDAGTDIVLCANNAEVQLAGAITIAGGGAWSGGAGSYSPSANDLNAEYTPTAGEIAAGTLTLTLTTTGNGDCLPESDDVEINFTPAPTVSASLDQTVCANSADVALNGSISVATGGIWTGGNGSFSPNATALGAIYTPSAGEIAAGTVTLTLTSTGNGDCISVVDQMVITITPSPVVDAGVGTELCSNNPEISLNGLVTIASGATWSGGSGTFNPNANDLNATYAPSQSEINAGTLTLTLTSTGNGNCVAVTDNVTYTFGPSPTADAGTDIVLCANDADVQLAGAVTIAGGGTWTGGAGTFSPNANALGAEYTATAAEIAAGTLTLTLTTTGNGDCIAVTDEVEITFTPAPTANAGNDQTVCANAVAVALNGAVTVALGGTWTGGNGSFNPDASSLGAIYTPSAGEIAAGIVTLTLTTTGNGDCIAVVDQMIITITPEPTVDAGVGIELCSNNPEISLNGSVTIATGGTWSGGSGTFAPNANDLNATYTPSQSEINAGTLVLTLTSTSNGSCIAVTDNVTYTFGPSPTADAGTDIVLCSNNAAADLAGAVTIATGGTWSGGAGTFSPNVNALNAEYTPTAIEIANGSVTLTLTTTGNGDCLPETDEVAITFTPAPTANASVDQTVCANAADVTLNGTVTIATGGTWSGGDGSFSPDANTLGATYLPSAAEITAGTVTLTLTTTGNGLCNSVANEMVITITPEPIVDAGIGTEFCSNNPEIALNGAVAIATGGTWSGGSGTFNPNANDLNATYNPSQSEINAGTLTLTLTSTGNGNCVPVTDNVTYTFGPSPTADAGADIELCSNNATADLAGAVTIATGGTWSGGAGTFSPNANALDAEYTPSAIEIANGTVTLTLTTTGNGDCIAVTDEVEISFTPSPTANAGLDQTVCANAANITLNGSVTVATGGTWSGGSGTFTPDASAFGAIYSPSAGEIAAGTVTLTLTTTGNGDCVEVTDQMTITITPEPTVDAGVGIEVCSNNSEISLSGSVTTATGGTWSGGSGTFSPNANDLNATYTPSQSEINAGILTLTLTSTGNGTCIAVTDNVAYTFGPSPTSDAGINIVACANNAEVQLDGSVTIATGGIWSGGNGNFSPSETTLNAFYTPTLAEIAAGSVTLTLTTTGNGDCLEVIDQVVVSFTPAPTASASIDQTVCANAPDLLLNGSVTIATGGTWTGGTGTYNPDANTLGATYTPSAAEIAAGTLTLTLTTTGNGLCNSVADQMVITITPEPTVDAGAGFELCSNNPEITLNGSVTIATGGTWTGGNGTFTPSANDLNAVYAPSQGEITDGSVTLTLTTSGNGNCIAVTDDVTYTFGPSPTSDAGADFEVCSNNADAQLAAAVTVSTGGTWSGGAGTFSPNANTLNSVYSPTAQEIADGSVTLTLTTTGNGDCIAVTDEVEVSFSPAPTANAGLDRTVCANAADVTLNGSATIATGGTWSGGNGTFSPDANTLGAIYSPSAGEIAAGSVTLTLTTIGNDDCNAVTDQMIISITPEPIVDAGIGTEFCSNNPEITLNGSLAIASGGTWSGGSGTFNPGANDLNATYTPSQSEINAGSLTLTLTSTGNGTCVPVTDVVTYTFGPSPTADAGTDIELCSNNATAQLAGAVTVATGGTWSGGAGSFSPNANALDAAYTPTAQELADGSVTLTLTTTGNADCLPVTDEVEISFTPAPTANAGTDQTVCANDVEVNLNGFVSVATGGTWIGGSGTFTPDANALNATYVPSASEIANGLVTLTLTTTGNGDCLPESDQMTITIDPEPVVLAGADLDICSNNADIQLNGSVLNATGGQWTGGLGSFNPDNTTLAAVYTPSFAEIAAGSITLTLTSTGNGNCLAESDAFVINFTPAPTVDAGEDITLCAATPNASLDGGYTVAGGAIWSGGNGVFSPNALDTNATYIPTPQEILDGSVTLTLTTTANANCVPESDEVTIFFDPEPTITAGSNLISCANNPTVQLEGAFTNASGVQWTGGTGFFNPNDETANAIYTPSAAEITNGFVSLTIESIGTGACPQVTDQMSITITPAPVVDAGANLEVCANNNTAQLSGSVQFAVGGQWSGGLGNFTPSNNSLTASYQPTAEEIAAGSVTLTLTSLGNGSCDAVSDQITISFTPAPVIDAGVDQTLCENNPNVQLAGSFTVSEGANWSGGAGSFSPNNNTPNAIYTPSPSELANGTVTLTFTTFGNGNCLPVSDQVTFSITPSPVVEVGNDFFACVDDLAVPLNGQVSGGSTTGTWTTSGTGIFVPNASALNGSYLASSQDSLIGEITLTLTSTNNGNCTAVSDDFTVFISPAGTADAGSDQFICKNNANVSLSGSIGGAATEGAWISSGTGVFLPNNEGTDVNYIPSDADLANGSVTFTFEVNSCNQAADDVLVTFTPVPEVNAGVDITVCSSEVSIDLTGLVSGASSTGIWTTTGSGSFSPNADDLNATYVFSSADVDDQTIELILTSTNIGDCIVVTDTLILEIFPQGSVSVGDDIVTCDNSPEAEVSAAINGGDQILWSTTGTGSFVPNNTSLIATYVPSAGDLLNGSVNLTATVTNSCNQASDFLNLSFIPGPAADAGEDQDVCGAVIPFQIIGNVANAAGGQWATTGSGAFQNVNSLNTFYVASQADIDNGGVFLILTTTGNGNCFANADSLFLDINTGIAVEAGPDQVVCSEAGGTQLFGQVSEGTTTGIWTSTGDGTFSPSATSLNATYNFTQNEIDGGAVTLTLTSTNNGICSEAIDSFEMTFGDGAFVYAGEDTEVCEIQDLVNLNGVVNGDSNTGIWSTTGTGGFFPTNTSLSAFYEPSQADLDAGSVEITLTSTNSVLCNEGAATIIVTFQSLPEANAGADAVICGSIEGVQLLGSVTGASGGVWESTGSGVFMPNDSVLTAIYTPSQADSIIGGATLTLTTYGNGFCAAGNDQVEVSFSAAVTANAGIDVEICEDQTAVQVEGTVSGSSNFNWTTSGGGTFTPQSDVLNPEYQLAQADLDAGTVTLYLTAQGNGSCPAFTDSLVVSIDRVPEVEIIAEAAVCSSDPAVELNGNVSDEDSFIWTSIGAGTFSPDNVSEEVTYSPSAAELAAGVTTITLTATSDGVCGSNSEDFEVTFIQPATVGAGADQIFCSTDGSVQLSGSSSTGEAIWSTTSFGTFDPDNTSLDATYVFGENDILVGFAELVITSTNNGPCEATTDTVRFTINPAPIVSAGPDQFVCETSGLLTMSGSADNFETIEWSTEGDGMFLNTGDVFAPEYIFGNADVIAEQVQIIITATGFEGCAEGADTMLVNINAPLAAAFTASNGCVGSPVQFTDATEVFEGEIDGYIWNFGNGIIDNQQNPTFVFNEAGTQSVRLVVESSLGCTDTTTQLINVVQGPQAAFTANQFRAPVNFDFIFDDQSNGAEQWNWNFGDGLGITQVQNPTYSYPDEGDYLVILTVTGSTGCVDSISQSLIVEGQTVLPPRLPNSFSPNGDNNNDVYFVRGGPFITIDFKVYDNWGREIFQTTAQEVGWDGTENGSDVPVGVYVYTNKATNIDGETFDSSGRINLFR